jgi:predicted O-methyltransferase YrrM
VRLSSFWPPQHARARLLADGFQRRHPGLPWIPRDAIVLLSELLLPTDRCLEWGSGSSTAWLATRTASLLSVEHDPEWYERVRVQLAQQGLDSGSVRLLSVDPVQAPASSPYVRVIEEFDDGALDVCFVDGEHRAACVLAAIPKLASGALLVLDDAHGVLDHRTSSPHSRQGQGAIDADWTRIAALVQSWRLIWSSDGYSDAAIWFAP